MVPVAAPPAMLAAIRPHRQADPLVGPLARMRRTERMLSIWEPHPRCEQANPTLGALPLQFPEEPADGRIGQGFRQVS